METFKALEEELLSLWPASRAKKRDALAYMEVLDAKCGSPSRSFESVHVAGTNGKGSVATKIAAGLRAAGKKVGLLTSPHIATFRERIVIDGEMISEELVRQLLPPLLKQGGGYSFFEYVTALAFLAFAHCQVDMGVVEVGLGGRLDATNCLFPKLSVITSIDLDHTHLLGETKEAIAYEKGGIIKPGVPVCLGPNASIPILSALAFERGCRCHGVKGPFAHYDAENSAVAKEALLMLGIDRSAVALGVEATPSFRFEQVAAEVPVIFDVAHNLAGLKALFKRLEWAFPQKKFRCVVAFSKEKKRAELLSFLKQRASGIHLTQGEHPRMQEIDETEGERSVLKSVMMAYQRATTKGEVVVICGSIYLMHEAKQALKKVLCRNVLAT